MILTPGNFISTIVALAMANAFTGWSHHGMTWVAAGETMDATICQCIALFILWCNGFMSLYQLKVERRP